MINALKPLYLIKTIPEVKAPPIKAIDPIIKLTYIEPAKLSISISKSKRVTINAA